MYTWVHCDDSSYDTEQMCLFAFTVQNLLFPFTTLFLSLTTTLRYNYISAYFSPTPIFQYTIEHLGGMLSKLSLSLHLDLTKSMTNIKLFSSAFKQFSLTSKVV